jgi:hypothetical protein
MDVTASAHAAALWAGLLILLMLVLSLLVVRQRAKHEVMLGDDGVPELARASRAFGNAAEYAPAGIAALAVLALVQAPPLVLHNVGATQFVGRVAHAIGLSLTGGPSPGRVVGMIATWLAFIFAGVALLFYAIS